MAENFTSRQNFGRSPYSLRNEIILLYLRSAGGILHAGFLGAGWDGSYERGDGCGGSDAKQVLFKYGLAKNGSVFADRQS